MTTTSKCAKIELANGITIHIGAILTGKQRPDQGDGYAAEAFCAIPTEPGQNPGNAELAHEMQFGDRFEAYYVNSPLQGFSWKWNGSSVGNLSHSWGFRWSEYAIDEYGRTIAGENCKNHVLCVTGASKTEAVEKAFGQISAFADALETIVRRRVDALKDGDR
jgi:hypothetical protein